MKREFSLKQIMQMILVCLLLVAVVYIFYRADHAELSQLNGPVTASQGAAPLENESDPALRSFVGWEASRLAICSAIRASSMAGSPGSARKLACTITAPSGSALCR